MPRRIAILQPGYLPWLGYFDQLARVDLFVHYDDAQYTRRDWRNRNRIKRRDGLMWLTVPVNVRGRFEIPLNEVKVSNPHWQTHHLRSIRAWLGRSPYFDECFPKLERWLASPWEYLVDLCIAGIDLLRGELGINTTVLRSSELHGLSHLKRSQRLIAICHRLGATEYLSGAAARTYLDTEAFARAGIHVLFQDYQHPHYTQLWGAFSPYLSIIDLLMNEGVNASRTILTRGTPSPPRFRATAEHPLFARSVKPVGRPVVLTPAEQ